MDDLQVRVLGSNVLVRLRDRQQKVGLIHLPRGSYLQAEDVAEVVAVGQGRWTKKGGWVPFEFGPGDKVLVNRIMEKTQTQKGIQARLQEFGDGYLLLDGRKDILGIVEEEDGEAERNRAAD